MFQLMNIVNSSFVFVRSKEESVLAPLSAVYVALQPNKTLHVDNQFVFFGITTACSHLIPELPLSDVCTVYSSTRRHSVKLILRRHCSNVRHLQ